MNFNSPIKTQIDREKNSLFWAVDAKNFFASSNIISETILQSQWYDQREAQDLLEQHLGNICVHARKYTSYYKKLLSNVLIDKKRGIKLSEFHKIPILKRQDIQDNTKRMHSKHPKMEIGATDLPTSGSTSEPVVVRWARCSYLYTTILQERWYRWAGLDGNKNLARLYSDAPKSKGNMGNFSNGWMDGFPKGGYATNSSALPISHQTRWLAHIKPNYLMAYPANAVSVFQYAEEHKLDLSSIEKILTYGEVLTPDIKNMFEKKHDIEVIDKYSSREVGCMALKCKNSDLYHIQTSNVYLEILREDGTPAKEGEVGKIVVTSLTNTSMPIIRYEIGDYATVGPKCDCGRGLPTIKNIMGRARNMAKDKNGDSFWPRFHSDDFALLIPVRQIQLIQRDYDKIHALYVSDAELSENDLEIMHDEIQKIFKDNVDISTERVEFIGREWGSKFEDFKCEI
ncbi:phenylacetate--CoA ligase family protein [Pseudemcibacter aquimaris]|uniref:phenylacetate--CoA ligase family protein n=1 Tax=Pseudemcibacter aquimaris TaxID=2857064 RepID=UPI002013A211|nr:hypothetical protein [Pseudemcibacter aquimaris]MCC3860672.1 hypothetical protein [Pseudemcibacter aquimaris]WDU59492.1 hypothetical protein KW060_04365 [Pseudemcibacter aquimaris]